MGINGLLKLLEAARARTHVSAYAGHKVAIDAYCWLHKGVYSCSTELALGVPTDRWLAYCLKKVDILRSNKVVPVMVFDGGHLPLKKSVEVERRRRRDDAKKRGLELYRQENYRDAESEFVKAVDITTEMAVKLIRQLQAGGVECIIAPYEADAQLAFLAITGYVHAVITEDSDLLAFGAPRVMFKMEKTGDGDEITRDAIYSLASPSFANWTPTMFRHMCILMGCDYTPSITGLGPKKAFGLVSKFKAVDRVLQATRLDTKAFTVPPEYEEKFRQADLTFLHQRVYCPLTKRMVTLTPLPDALTSTVMDFLGPPMPADLCHAIATAEIDPYTMAPYPKPSPLPEPPAKRSISMPTFGVRKKAKADKRNLLTNYMAPVASARAAGQFKPPRPLGSASTPAAVTSPSESPAALTFSADDYAMNPTSMLLNGSIETIPDSPPDSDPEANNESSDVEIIDGPWSDPPAAAGAAPAPVILIPATPPKVIISKYFSHLPGSPTAPAPVARNLTRELMMADEAAAKENAAKKPFVSPNVAVTRLSLGRRPAVPATAPMRSFLSPYFASPQQPK